MWTAPHFPSWGGPSLTKKQHPKCMPGLPAYSSPAACGAEKGVALWRRPAWRKVSLPTGDLVLRPARHCHDHTPSLGFEFVDLEGRRHRKGVDV